MICKFLFLHFNPHSVLRLTIMMSLCAGFDDFWEFDTTTYQWSILDVNVSDSVGMLRGKETLTNQI